MVNGVNIEKAVDKDFINTLHVACDSWHLFYTTILSSFQPENYRLETKYENHLIVKVALVCIQSACLLVTVAYCIVRIACIGVL